MHKRLYPKVVAVLFVIAIFMTGVVVVNAAPLVLYQGDSIVKKKESNGYAWVSCALLGKDYDVRCDTAHSCCLDGNSGFPGSYTKNVAIIEAQRPDVLHFNQGIDVINCLNDADDDATGARLSAYQDYLWKLIGEFYNRLPGSAFIFGASTRSAVCVTNPYCNECGRYNANVVRINARSKEICDLLDIPYNDLYAVTVQHDLKTTDGRHFDAQGQLIIGKAAADVVRPYLEPTHLRVYLKSPNFDALVSSGDALDIAAEVTGGSADKVEFYDGQTLLGVDNTAPYTYRLENISAGQHLIRAKAVKSGTESVLSTIRPVAAVGFPMKLNAGSFTSPPGWIPDRMYSEGGYGFVGSPGFGEGYLGRQVMPAGTEIANTDLDEVFRTVRNAKGSMSDKPFIYRFSVPNGTFKVTLMFADYWQGAGGRLYTISVEGSEKCKAWDMVAEAGGKQNALLKTYEVTVSDRVLDIQLWAKNNPAIINGIMIEPVGTTGTSRATGSSTMATPLRVETSKLKSGVSRITFVGSTMPRSVAVIDLAGTIVAQSPVVGNCAILTHAAALKGVYVIRAERFVSPVVFR